MLKAPADGLGKHSPLQTGNFSHQPRAIGPREKSNDRSLRREQANLAIKFFFQNKR